MHNSIKTRNARAAAAQAVRRTTAAKPNVKKAEKTRKRRNKKAHKK